MTKSLIQIIIISLITAFLVVGLELYRKSKLPTLPEIVAEQLEPLDPSLPTQILTELENKASKQPLIELPTLPF